MYRNWISWLTALALCFGSASAVAAQTAPAPMAAASAAAATSTTTASANAPAATGAATTATTATATPQSTAPENNGKAATTAHSATSVATLQRQIAALPQLRGTGIDVGKRGPELLSHLNAILRFYRNAVTPAQKVGEPSDILYAEQSSAQATQVAQLAFEAAKNEALLLNKVSSAEGKASAAGDAGALSPSTETQHISATLARAQAQLDALEAQQAGVEQQLATARAKQRAPLQQQLQQVEGALELQHAMVEALTRVSSFSGNQTSTGLVGNIDRLQRSAPELLVTSTTKPPVPNVLESLANVHDAGLTTQAETLFSLLATLRAIDQQTAAVDALSKQAEDLRTPFLKVLRSTIAQGQVLLQGGDSATPAPGATPGATPAPADTRKQFDTLTSTFQVLADATLPLSQEIVLLDNTRGTLTTWRAAVNTEQRSVFRDLLVRVIVIAVALGIIAILSNVANRITIRYIGDLRRRRQLLFVRRAVVGFLSGLVLLFGFVTQFSSLATFAGFISAGIAVGLQSILLSVAAYFFIVGRYGVRVGDRITVAGVTGEVIEVGLVRFYMMELVGTGTELHTTGRVAVFANSVLFQTGTPIYKQMPGTEYAWHELTAKLTAEADVPAATTAIQKAIETVYASYSARIQAQHQQVEEWMGAAIPAPQIESRLQLADGGLQYAVLFPVELNHASTADQQIAQELVAAMREEPLKTALPALPVIKAAVKS